MSRKSVVLAVLAFAFLLAGAADVAYGNGPSAMTVQWVHMIASVFLIFLCYRFDSEDREFRRNPLLSVGVVALSIVAIPTYLFLSRGAKGGFVSIGWMLLYSFVCMLMVGAGAALAIVLNAA